MQQRQKLDAELDKTGSDISLHIEKGYTSENSIILLALTVFAGLITIGAAGIATGLAQADAEADLKTLAAVGAPPRVRRTLSGFQCGVVAAMGVVLGSAAGVLPAIGLRLTEKREQAKWYQEALDQGYSPSDAVPYVPILIPWETLAALLIAVPVGAALLAAAGHPFPWRPGPPRQQPDRPLIARPAVLCPRTRVDHSRTGAHRLQTFMCERMAAWRCRGMNGRRRAPMFLSWDRTEWRSAAVTVTTSRARSR